MMKMFGVTIYLIGGAVWASSVITKDDSTLNILPEMVVVDNARPQLTLTGAITIVDSIAIDNALAVHIGEVLNRTAGFTIRDGYQVPLLLRGLPGRTMLVLRNGNRRFSSYPAGYMTHTTNVYELERIDVLKGASSVQYGAGAIAGTINLVDRDPLKDHSGLSGRTSLGFNSNNEQLIVLDAAQWSGKRAGLRVAARIREADDYTNADGSKMENSSFKDKDLTINAAILPNDSTNIAFSADIHRGGPWEKPRGFTGTNYMLASTPIENSTSLSLNFEHHGSSLIHRLSGSAFYSREYRQLQRQYFAAANMIKTYEETTCFSDTYFGMQVNATTKLHPRLNIHSGAEAYHFSISAPSSHKDYLANFSYQNRNSINARTTTGGFYSEIVATPADGIGITAGGRYDFSALYEGGVYSQNQNEERSANIDAASGAIGVRISRGLLVSKVNLSRSFRVPQTNELFTDSYTSRGILLANSELQPEYCYSLDAVFLVPGTYVSVEFDPFLWLFNNMISREAVRGMPGTVYTFTNVGKARLLGGEVQFSLSLNDLPCNGDLLTFSVSGAWVSGRDLSGEKGFFDRGEPLEFIPPLNMRSELDYQIGIGELFKINAGLNLTGYADSHHLPQGAYTSPGFITMGATGGLTWHKRAFTVQMQVAVVNLFNKTYYSFQSYLPASGRDVRVMTTVRVG